MKVLAQVEQYYFVGAIATSSLTRPLVVREIIPTLCVDLKAVKEMCVSTIDVQQVNRSRSRNRAWQVCVERDAKRQDCRGSPVERTPRTRITLMVFLDLRTATKNTPARPSTYYVRKVLRDDDTLEGGRVLTSSSGRELQASKQAPRKPTASGTEYIDYSTLNCYRRRLYMTTSLTCFEARGKSQD